MATDEATRRLGLSDAETLLERERGEAAGRRTFCLLREARRWAGDPPRTDVQQVRQEPPGFLTGQRTLGIHLLDRASDQRRSGA